MSAIVRTEGLVKRYDRTVAVAGIDLAIEQGEIFGLVGPNGAGKTTTLRMLATLLRPDAGRAEIDGWSVTRNPDEVRRVLGFMPDAFGFGVIMPSRLGGTPNGSSIKMRPTKGPGHEPLKRRLWDPFKFALNKLPKGYLVAAVTGKERQ